MLQIGRLAFQHPKLSHCNIPLATALIMIAYVADAQENTVVVRMSVWGCVAQAAVHAGGLCVATVVTTGAATIMTYAVRIGTAWPAGCLLASPACLITATSKIHIRVRMEAVEEKRVENVSYIRVYITCTYVYMYV